MTYPIQPGPSFPGSKLGKLPNPVSLAGQRRPVQTSYCGSRMAAAAYEGTYLIYELLARNPS